MVSGKVGNYIQYIFMLLSLWYSKLVLNFMLQLEGDREMFVAIDFFLHSDVVVLFYFSLLRFHGNHFEWFECVCVVTPAMTLIIEMLIKPNKFQ